MRKQPYKKALTRYNIANEIMGDEIDLAYLNYGYAYLDNDLAQQAKKKLQPEDIDFQYHINLYLHLANAINFAKKRVLEVGCGRGGGANSVMKYKQPQELIGIDLCTPNIEFATRHFAKQGLYFQQGNAEFLAFEDNSFDVVINVESAHCYPQKKKFFQEVFRVLNQDGYFLFTDIGTVELLSGYVLEIEKIGLRNLQTNNITPNVVRSLQLDHDRKQELFLKVSNNNPDKLEWLVNQTNQVGTEGYKKFAERTKEYWSYIFQKS